MQESKNPGETGEEKLPDELWIVRTISKSLQAGASDSTVTLPTQEAAIRRIPVKVQP
jgi:hypothetical protein